MSEPVGTSRQAAENNAAINRALANPLRELIMNELADRVASPKQLSETLKAPLDSVCKHLRILVKAGLAEIAWIDSQRQGAQHFYRLTARPILDTEHWDSLPRFRREQGTVGVARTIIGNLIEAIREGSFDDSTSRVQVRPPIVRFDQQAIEEADEAALDFLDAYDRIVGDASNRLAKSGEPGFPVAASILIFPMPDGS